LRGVSLAIVLPLPYEAKHLTGFGAPVTYVSRVSPIEKRATPSKASLLLLLGSNAPDAARQITVPGTELRLPGRSFACYQLTSAITEQHYVRKTASRPACTFICICVTSLPCRIVTQS